LCAVICILYAASDEWHQTFVPGRGGTWVDVVIDTGGVLIAAAITLWKAHRHAKRAVEPEALQPALTQAE